jgi:hypothetical protein
MKRQVDSASLHLYVTRAATLQYLRARGGGFEAMRRHLTELIIRALCDGAEQGTHYVAIESAGVRAWMQVEGNLLVVNKIEDVRATHLP